MKAGGNAGLSNENTEGNYTMIKSGKILTFLLAVLLALTLLPFSAMAVTENRLESAPELSMPEDGISDTGTEASEDRNQDEAIYSPLLSELPERGTVQESDELNLPRLTDAELVLIRELMADREAGAQTDFEDRHYAGPEKVLEAGVYPLDPKEFGGNTFYVILPYFQMDRNQLLNLLHAFEELGISFDPDSLNSTNCVRGTSLLSSAATRRLSQEEQNRMNEIRGMISRGVWDNDTFVPDSACLTVQVQEPGYSNLAYEYLKPFCFYPYRAMTDHELATFALAQETEWEIRPDALEKEARKYAHSLVPLPLSMTAYNCTRYMYGEDLIEFRNYFRIEDESCSGLYASREETPMEVMVEQELYGKQDDRQAEAEVARILIDYPAQYEIYEIYETGKGLDSEAKCSEEELKAAARRWTERYLLIPAEDILSDWVFDQRNDDWGSVQYRLLTTDWLVCLEMTENSASYCQCCIYNREYAVEFDDWDLNGAEQTVAEEAAEADESEWRIDSDTIDENARRELHSLLNLPQNMITDDISQPDNRYVQYRSDYSFITEDSAGEKMPSGMIVYQSPNFTNPPELFMESVFISYPAESAGNDRLSDEEYLSAARKWAEKNLLISGEEILADWTCDPEGSEDSETVVYQLQTSEWMIYLRMNLSGDYSWAGLYHLDTHWQQNN